MTFFSIDGFSWEIPCTVERNAEMTASDISGMLLDRTIFNDVLGTYMEYDVKIAVPNGKESDYNTLHGLITDPKGYHECILPYDDGYLQITGKIDDIKDIYIRLPQSRRKWRGISFTITSLIPTRRYRLGEILRMGAMPLPDEEETEEGTAFAFTDAGWVEMADAEDFYY